jgi:L-rhamnose mutarotase
MRVALHGTLREGRELDYERAHRVVPAELLALLQRAGIDEWVTWRSGREVFHLVESDDFEAAIEIITRDPIDERWQAVMDEFVESFASNPEGEAGVGLRPVWSLRDQVEATREDDASETGGAALA